MNEYEPDPDDILASTQDSQMTYFAFARSSGQPPKQPSAKAKGKSRKRSVKHRQAAKAAASSGLPNVLAGRYQIERLVGAGGMGAVYRARDLLLEQFGDPDPYVALKMMNDEYSDAPDASALLFSEFVLTRRLRHPNIARVHSFEVDTQWKQAFITMELMRGLTLDKLLCERPMGLPWQELRDLVLPLLDALAYSHACKVIHGDVKPSNVMLCEDGVRLFDFGLSQVGGTGMCSLPQLDRGRLRAWTPMYAAPELLDWGVLSVSSDVFAVACVIYEMASGKHPFKRFTSVEGSYTLLNEKLQAPRHLPRRCWSVLRRALSLDPLARPPTLAPLQAAFSQPGSLFDVLLSRCKRRSVTG